MGHVQYVFHGRLCGLFGAQRTRTLRSVLGLLGSAGIAKKGKTFFISFEIDSVDFVHPLDYTIDSACPFHWMRRLTSQYW